MRRREDWIGRIARLVAPPTPAWSPGYPCCCDAAGPYTTCPNCCGGTDTLPGTGIYAPGHCPPCCWVVRIPGLQNGTCADCALLDGTLDTISVAPPCIVPNIPRALLNGYRRLCVTPAFEPLADCIAVRGLSAVDSGNGFNPAVLLLRLQDTDGRARLTYGGQGMGSASWATPAPLPWGRLKSADAATTIELPFEAATEHARGGFACAWHGTTALVSPFTPTTQHPWGTPCPGPPADVNCLGGSYAITQQKHIAEPLPATVTLTIAGTGAFFDGVHVLDQFASCASWSRCVVSGSVSALLQVSVGPSCANPANMFVNCRQYFAENATCTGPTSVEWTPARSGSVAWTSPLDRYGRAELAGANGASADWTVFGAYAGTWEVAW